MTICSWIPSWWGVLLGVIVLVVGFITGYKLSKKVAHKGIRVICRIGTFLLILFAALTVVSFTGIGSCPSVPAPTLVYDYQTQIDSLQEAEDVFASYLAVYAPESVAEFKECVQRRHGYIEKGYGCDGEGCGACATYIEEVNNNYLIYGNYGTLGGRFILNKDGKLHSQQLIGMI